MFGLAACAPRADRLPGVPAAASAESTELARSQAERARVTHAGAAGVVSACGDRGGMRAFAEGAAATVAVVLQLVVFVLVAGTSMGVVREHCLDLEASSVETGADIDEKWTYILWPPLALSNLDPAGGCVRNSPLREGLNAVGIWPLPSAEAQVREHVEQQIQ